MLADIIWQIWPLLSQFRNFLPGDYGRWITYFELQVLNPYPYQKRFYFISDAYFSLITASWFLICCPIVRNHSNIRKYWFHAAYVAKKLCWINFLVSECISKGQQIRDILNGRERNRLKNPEQITSVAYLHIALFRIHKYSHRQRTWYCITSDSRARPITEIQPK